MTAEAVKITSSLPFTPSELAGLAGELNAIRQRELPALRRLWQLAQKYHQSGQLSEHEQETIRHQYRLLRDDLRCCGGDGLPEWMVDDIGDNGPMTIGRIGQYAEMYRKWFLEAKVEDIRWPVLTA